MGGMGGSVACGGGHGVGERERERLAFEDGVVAIVGAEHLDVLPSVEGDLRVAGGVGGG